MGLYPSTLWLWPELKADINWLNHPGTPSTPILKIGTLRFNLPNVIEWVSRRAGIQTQKFSFNFIHLTASLCCFLGVWFFSIHTVILEVTTLTRILKFYLYLVESYQMEGNMDVITRHSCFMFIFSNCFYHKSNSILIRVYNKGKIKCHTTAYFNLL